MDMEIDLKETKQLVTYIQPVNMQSGFNPNEAQNEMALVAHLSKHPGDGPIVMDSGHVHQSKTHFDGLLADARTFANHLMGNKLVKNTKRIKTSGTKIVDDDKGGSSLGKKRGRPVGSGLNKKKNLIGHASFDEEHNTKKFKSDEFDMIL